MNETTFVIKTRVAKTPKGIFILNKADIKQN